MGGGYQCKRTIDEEEAEAEAKVRSMIHEEWPHPLLTGLAPPTPEVLIHVQPGEREESDEVMNTVASFVLHYCIKTSFCQRFGRWAMSFTGQYTSLVPRLPQDFRRLQYGKT